MLRLGWVSTWNARCGIAEYSRFLLSALDPQHFDVTILGSRNDELIAQDEEFVVRCWANAAGSVSALLREVVRRRFDILVVQFQFSLLSLRHLEALVASCHAVGTRLIVLFHVTNSDDFAAAVAAGGPLVRCLASVERLLVHTEGDAERLRGFGMETNVEVFPHGFSGGSPVDQADARAGLGLPADGLVIGSYGFLMPYKGIDVLVEAVALLRDAGRPAKLLMVNSLYPHPISQELLDRCRTLAKEKGILDDVVFETGFLSNEDSLKRLAACDLIVFPYQPTRESSSAAVRIGIGSGRPVLCSPVPIFADVADVVDFLPGTTAPEVRDGILAFLDDPERWQRLKERQEQWREQHDWRRVAGLMQTILERPRPEGTDMEHNEVLGAFVAAQVAEREAADQAAQTLRDELQWLRTRMERADAENAQLRAQTEAQTNRINIQSAQIEAQAVQHAAQAAQIAAQIDELARRAADFDRDRVNLRAEVEVWRLQLEEVHKSTSWRVTRPLRAVSQLLGRGK